MKTGGARSKSRCDARIKYSKADRRSDERSNRRRPRLLGKKESENPRLKVLRRRDGNHRSLAAGARSRHLFMNRNLSPVATEETR